jgi:type VI secretion system protein VasI
VLYIIIIIRAIMGAVTALLLRIKARMHARDSIDLASILRMPMSCRSIASLAIVVVAPVLLRAQVATQGDLSRCAAITSHLRRLACYDSLAHGRRPTVAEPLGVRSDSSGRWEARTETSPLDDSQTEYLMLRATTGTARFGMPVAFVIRCQNRKTEAYIAWSEYLGSGGADVLTRLGTSSARAQNWSLSSDGRATFVPGNVPDFVQQLAAVGRFVAQVTPYNESPVTATFDVGGLQVAIRPLRAACGW